MVLVKSSRRSGNWRSGGLTHARTHAQALLIGANFPRSKGLSQTFAWACLSNPNITNFGGEVVGYSEAAAFLVVRLSTTACERFSVQITSDGFIGNASA